MYGAIKNGDLIAWHEKKKVVKSYINEQREFGEKLTLVKIIDEKFDMNKYIDLYLYRLGDTYIQDKYFHCVEMFGERQYDDLLLAKDVITRLYTNTKDSKDAKYLSKVMIILENELDMLKNSNYSLKDLEGLHIDYERMKNYSSEQEKY